MASSVGYATEFIEPNKSDPTKTLHVSYRVCPETKINEHQLMRSNRPSPFEMSEKNFETPCGQLPIGTFEIDLHIKTFVSVCIYSYQPRKITQRRLHCIQIKNNIFSLSRHRHRCGCCCCLRRDSPRALEQKWNKRYPENAQCSTAVGIWNDPAIYKHIDIFREWLNIDDILSVALR